MIKDDFGNEIAYAYDCNDKYDFGDESFINLLDYMLSHSINEMYIIFIFVCARKLNIGFDSISFH